MIINICVRNSSVGKWQNNSLNLPSRSLPGIVCVVFEYITHSLGGILLWLTVTTWRDTFFLKQRRQQQRWIYPKSVRLPTYKTRSKCHCVQSIHRLWLVRYNKNKQTNKRLITSLSWWALLVQKRILSEHPEYQLRLQSNGRFLRFLMNPKANLQRKTLPHLNTTELIAILTRVCLFLSLKRTFSANLWRYVHKSITTHQTLWRAFSRWSQTDSNGTEWIEDVIHIWSCRHR